MDPYSGSHEVARVSEPALEVLRGDSAESLGDGVLQRLYGGLTLDQPSSIGLGQADVPLGPLACVNSGDCP